MDGDSGWAGGDGRMFDDPFLLYSSESMPEDLQTALDLCLFLYHMSESYRQSTSRVCSYFITDFNFPEDGSKNEKDDWKKYLRDQIKFLLFLTEVGNEWACYGNAFIRIHFPFDRFLIDRRRGLQYYSLAGFGNSARYDYQKMMYSVPDPANPGSRFQFPFLDRKSTDMSRIRLRLINPRFVTIRHCMVSGASRFVYRFENTILDDVKRSRLHVVNEMPMAMLRAISKNQDFLFDDDIIYHFRAPTVSGVSNYGWGLPGVIANYRNIHQIQVYRKIDEAVGLDYLLPFRIFSPMAKGDPGMSGFDEVNMGQWNRNIRALIRNRRRDKFAIHSFPFPVTYDEHGGDGKNLTPKELLEYQNKMLLEGCGYPQELFAGSLQYLQVPTALRLFETSFMFLHSGFSSIVQWASKKIRDWQGLPSLETTLQRPSMADSLERKQLLFQLASTGEISRETAYETLGIDDPVAEMRKRLDEDAEIQRDRTKKEQELQREQEVGAGGGDQQGQPGGQPGSAPGQQGGAPGVTPMDTNQSADQLAQYWRSIPDVGTRRKAMDASRQDNEQLYALAMTKLDQMRRQDSSAGRQQGDAQAQQGGQQGGPPGGGGQAKQGSFVKKAGWFMSQLEEIQEKERGNRRMGEETYRRKFNMPADQDGGDA